MAERRMFAKTIIDSDAFLDMPLSTQSLYFHLSMRADDDGFINNPKKIQRMIGASDDDLRVLVMKRFILPFDMSNVPVEQIYKGLKKFTYTPRESHYETVLAKGKAKYADDHKGMVSVMVRMRYNDLELGRVVEKGESIDVKPERADVLIQKGLVEIAW
jgi:hypothetical protein